MFSGSARGEGSKTERGRTRVLDADKLLAERPPGSRDRRDLLEDLDTLLSMNELLPALPSSATPHLETQQHARVERRHPRRRSSRVLHLSKIVHIRVVSLEPEDEGVGRERVPGGVELVEEGELVSLGSDLRLGG